MRGLVNTTAVPNEVLDSLHDLSGCECKVLLVIIRSTLGWHKEHDWISHSQLAARSGVSARTLNKVISSLVERGYLAVHDSQGKALRTPQQRKKAKKLIYSYRDQRTLVQKATQKLRSTKDIITKRLVERRKCGDRIRSIKRLDNTSYLQDRTGS